MKSGVEYLAQHPGWKTKPDSKEQYVKIEVKQLEALIVKATDALEAFGEDFVMDTLYSLRDTLQELVEDPDRRLGGYVATYVDTALWTGSRFKDNGFIYTHWAGPIKIPGGN